MRKKKVRNIPEGGERRAVSNRKRGGLPTESRGKH